MQRLIRLPGTFLSSAVAGATGYRIYKSENTQLYDYIWTTEDLSFRDDNIGPDLSVGPPIGDNPFVNAAFAFTEPFPVGLIITLISALILRKRKQDLQNEQDEVKENPVQHVNPV